MFHFLSGGKDSCFNMMHCVQQGHEIVALANLKPEGKGTIHLYYYLKIKTCFQFPSFESRIVEPMYIQPVCTSDEPYWVETCHVAPVLSNLKTLPYTNTDL